MNTLTNEQIVRVFAMYWNCEYQRDAEGNGHFFNVFGAMLDNAAKSIDGRKLLLTPLSAISDEDAIEVARLMGYDFETTKLTKKELIEQGKDFVKHYHYPSSGFGMHYIELHEWLKQQGYAVPLYFGPKHPDNRKTAIELGLATIKTKEAI